MSKVSFKIAGKKKTLTFTNELVALAFIKDASVRFGDKFAVRSRPDQCPECGSLENTAYYNDGRRYDPFNDKGLWDKFKCKDCGNEWPFKFVSMAPQQDADNNAPITSGISDINGGAPDFKEAGLGNNRDYKTNDRRVRTNLARHKELMDKYISEGMSKEEVKAADEKEDKAEDKKEDKSEAPMDIEMTSAEEDIEDDPEAIEKLSAQLFGGDEKVDKDEAKEKARLPFSGSRLSTSTISSLMAVPNPITALR